MSYMEPNTTVKVNTSDPTKAGWVGTVVRVDPDGPWGTPPDGYPIAVVFPDRSSAPYWFAASELDPA
jgi:hypothetical protein